MAIVRLLYLAEPGELISEELAKRGKGKGSGARVATPKTSLAALAEIPTAAKDVGKGNIEKGIEPGMRCNSWRRAES
eukprot:5347201-Pyramimonas_sp.AAC.1